ncbi:MAG: glycosyltransferase family 39 protein [Bacillales bacterium]|nr:glycosyltransferase family 39 protein [Bacillales bacterium]
MNSVFLNFLIFFVSLIFGGSFLFLPYFKEWKKFNLFDFIKQNKFYLFLSLAMLFLILSRTFLLDIFPGGLNQDEASAGYDAYAIMTTGCDRNGQFLPMHLISWGSGQNALYSYLCIPFIFLFGLNEIAIRLPMGIIGVISIVLVYDLFKRLFNKEIGLLAALFFIISPWHFMKSRWALESNIFPDLVFIGVYFLIVFLIDHKKYKLYFSSLILALSSYGYGTSYFFLFFFIIGTIVYLIVTKKLKWYQGAIYISIVGLICLPVMLFLYVNIFDHEEMKFLFITIPKLTQNRFQAVTNIFSGNFLKNGMENMGEGFRLLLTQDDYLPWNNIKGIGTIYLISLPFTIYGLFNKDNKTFNWILRIWLIVSILMMFIVSPNINRINIIYFPLIILTFLGIKDICSLSKRITHISVGTYSAYFLIFIFLYTSSWNNQIKSSFYDSFGDALRYASSLEAEHYYVTSNVNMPYIYVLFYEKYDNNEYINSVKYLNEGDSFQYVLSFGKYTFTLPYDFIKNNVYIIDKGNQLLEGKDLSLYDIKEFDQYYVINVL